MRNGLSVLYRYINKKKSAIAFWWLPVKAGKNMENGMEKDYYVDFSSKVQYTLLFDEEGVIMLDYLGDVGKQYNPCAVAQYGLGLVSKYLETKDEIWKKKAIIQADWLLNAIKYTDNNVGRLEYAFDYGSYEMIQKENYISGIAQAQALSLLIRIFQITGDNKYLMGIEGLFQSFMFDVHEGGVINYDEKNRLYIEEIITEKVSCVLDGFMYGIFGVYDYYLFSGSEDARGIFEQACHTLSEILPDFDLKFWSRADCYLKSPKMPASAFYHNVHIHQLTALYRITGNATIKEYAEKWKVYQDNPIYRIMAFAYKCWFKLFYY